MKNINKPAIAENEIKKLRKDFPKLMLKNPNYFGNLEGSNLKATLIMTANTSYEEIAEVGYNPEHDQLYAVVSVKKSTGYSSTLCYPGSYEYVRFYVDWNGDGDFVDAAEDEGVGSVNVHDIPVGDKPLNYCVSVKPNPKKKLCQTPYLVKVRAILSWNAMPAANTPNYVPVWGEVQECWIQIEPAEFVLGPLIDSNLVKIDKILVNSINTSASIMKPVKYSTNELKKLYQKKKIEGHRINVKEVAGQMKKLSVDANIAAYNMDPEIKDAIELATASPSNTSYEELQTIGLQYDNDTLTAIFKVKKPYGFSGDLCTTGSMQYVAFFADWDKDGVFEEYLGTASVSAHDIPGIPAEGLEYAVSLPVDLATKKKLCSDPQVFKIRGILSWNVTPDPDPDYVPVWGNIVDVNIQIKPGEPVVGTDQIPYISTVGDIVVTDIDAGGLATGTAVVSGFQASDSPFGGWVTIAGHISNPPNISAGAANLKYYASYRKVGDLSWTKITNKFEITISEWDGYVWSQYQMDQSSDGDGCYNYQEDLAVSPPTDTTQRFVEGFVMSKWYTGGFDDGLYEVKLTLKDAAGDIDSNIVKVMLDNTKPTVALTITEVEVGGVTNPAQPCGVFTQGCIIKGTFSAEDTNFKNYYFTVEPSILSPNSVSPSTGAYPAISGASGQNWSLDTTGMQACGYVIHIHAYDRTVVNSGYVGFYTHTSVGFCLT